MNREVLYAMLEKEVVKRNIQSEISEYKPDPLLIASKYQDEYIALICALFSYGDVRAIVNFLSSLDFSLLDANEHSVREKLAKHYYRFQNANDIGELFVTLGRMKNQASLESIFLQGYTQKSSVMDGLSAIISSLYDINSYRSRGYQFLLGKIPTHKTTSPYKRFHMFLRWMVRDDHLDLGLWRSVDKKDLLMPLDTHTFKVGQKLGLIERKVYDFKAVLELTEALKTFDKSDPVKYDFALYRLGQEKLL